MRAYDVIRRKRDGGVHPREELEWWVRGIADGSISDEQVAAWAMAVFFRGLDKRETADLTRAMAYSGAVIDLRDIPGVKVDKHSTGGVGDTTTLVVAPLVAVCGVPVAKLSGRALGHTGGTLDKLASIPGLRLDLSQEQFVRQVRQVGIALAGQTREMVPADKRLYAIRDVTATVDSLPLIAASVMSKKIAGGADAIVLDVKTGGGALLKTSAQALELAQLMVDIGRRLGRRTVALVTDMSQPLGRAVGNALEVKEAIATLRGDGPPALTELCLTLGGYMVWLAGAAEDPQAGRERVARALRSGDGLRMMKAWLAAQGGDPRVVDEPDRLPTARHREPWLAPRTGYVAAVDAEALGTAAMILGTGRSRQDEAIDPAAGLWVHRRLGDWVEAGEPLLDVHYNEPRRAQMARSLLMKAFTIADRPPLPPPLVQGVVGIDDGPGASAGTGLAGGKR